MAKTAIGNIYITLGGIDISSHVESAKVSLGKAAVDVTALGDAWEDVVSGGVSRWAVTLGVYQDYASSEAGGDLYGLFKGAVTNSSGLAVFVRPTSAVTGAANPSLAGNVMLDGDYDWLNAARNSANKFTVTLKGMNVLTMSVAAT